MAAFFNKNEPATKQVTELPTLAKQRDFTQDITPLLFMIRHELTKAINVMGGEELNVNIIREDFIRKACSEAANNVFSGLAPTYLEVLTLYFTQQRLVDYIAEHVTQELITKGLMTNRKVFNSDASNPNIAKESLPNVEASKDMG